MTIDEARNIIRNTRIITRENSDQVDAAMAVLDDFDPVFEERNQS